jgi:hypothetical protein
VTSSLSNFLQHGNESHIRPFHNSTKNDYHTLGVWIYKLNGTRSLQKSNRYVFEISNLIIIIISLVCCGMRSYILQFLVRRLEHSEHEALFCCHTI